jgi:hypothetical protein
LPSISIRPEVGDARPMIMRATVVLPDPDSPAIPKMSPRQIVRLAFCTAVTGGRAGSSHRRGATKRFTTSLARTTGAVP